MSIRAVLWVTELHGVSPIERTVLLKLANHANAAGGSAWPSVGTIAEWAEVTPRNVRRILTGLIAARLIEVEGSNGRAGGTRSTTYRLTIPAGYGTRDPGQNRQGGEDKIDRGPRTKSAPEPVLEPVLEPFGPKGPAQQAAPVLKMHPKAIERESLELLAELLAESKDAVRGLLTTLRRRAGNDGRAVLELFQDARGLVIAGELQDDPDTVRNFLMDAAGDYAPRAGGPLFVPPARLLH